MIMAWGLYCVVVAALLGAAAAAGAAALRAWGRPARWAWLGGMAGSLIVPLAAWLGPFGAGVASSLPGIGVFWVDPLVIGVPAASFSPDLDRALLLIWVSSSLLLGAYMAWSLARLEARRGRWRRAEVEGVPVLVSRDLGPAALGLLRGAIVLPEWALSLERRLRRLVVLHEREHLRAGDPWLIVAGLALLIVMPWNPAVWWHYRRLRLAVELDCDGRVLRAAPDVGAYGTALLEVGRRRCANRLVAAALAEPRSFLERRIRMMTRTDPIGYGRLGGAALAGLAGVLLAVACWAPEPTDAGAAADAPGTTDAVAGADRWSRRITAPADGRVRRDTLMAGPTFTPYTVAPALTNREGVAAALAANYPPLLRDAGIGGTALIWFFIDETGAVSRTMLANSTGHEPLDQAALRVAQTFEFSAALNRDRPVPVWVALPIVFSPSSP